MAIAGIALLPKREQDLAHRESRDTYLHLKVSAQAEELSWQENCLDGGSELHVDLEQSRPCSHVFVSPLSSHASALPCLAQARKQNC